MRFLATLFCALMLGACETHQASTAKDGDPPAKVEKIDGSDLKRITLTPKASERIGIELTPAGQLQVPYSALLYDPAGTTWVYISPQQLVFHRQKVVVDAISQAQVKLTEGPAAGVQVVTVGAAELYGAENGLK